MIKDEALFEYLTAHYATELRSILADVAEHSFGEYRSITFNCEFGCITLSSNETKEPDKTFLPSNLDEAAAEYEYNLGYYECINQWPGVAFKVGAKWMAEQGVSMEITDETEWADVDNFVHRNCDGATVIQIRKKEE